MPNMVLTYLLDEDEEDDDRLCRRERRPRERLRSRRQRGDDRRFFRVRDRLVNLGVHVEVTQTIPIHGFTFEQAISFLHVYACNHLHH